MKKALSIINQMRDENIILKYAIGGGIAAVFFIEPMTTFGLDIFVIIEEKSSLLSMASIYSWLKKRGYKLKAEYVIIENTPIQFIPVYNELVKEAVVNAKEIVYENVHTFVIAPEYLFAIMVQTNRPKDRVRIDMFLKEADIDEKKLNKVLEKHSLMKNYKKIRRLLYDNK